MRVQNQDIIYDLTAFLESSKANIWILDSVMPQSCFSPEEFGPPSMKTKERLALSPVLETCWLCSSVCQVALLMQIFNCNLRPICSCLQREAMASHHPTLQRLRKMGLLGQQYFVTQTGLRSHNQSNQHPGKTGKRLCLSSLLIIRIHWNSMQKTRGETWQKKVRIKSQ